MKHDSSEQTAGHLYVSLSVCLFACEVIPTYLRDLVIKL